MALNLKEIFNRKVNTEGFTTEQFMSVLQDKALGSGYNKIQALRQGIKTNGNRLVQQDILLMNDLITIAAEHARVTNSELFKTQLESYIRSGEVALVPKEEESSVLRLDKKMRVETPENTEISKSRELKSTEELKTTASQLTAEANAFMKKIKNELPPVEAGSQKMSEPLTEVDRAHLARAQKANNPHGFEKMEPARRTGT